MNLQTLANLAWKHTHSALSEEIYLKTGKDHTVPVSFYGLVNERCNVKCRYCEYWRMKEYATELTIDEWKNALASIKEFVGKFSINFSGGEPYIKPGFLDLLEWCHQQGISAGVTTNGSALTPKNAARTVAARPFNVSISVDAPSAEVHDYLRGYPGLFDKLSKGIGHLLEERNKQGAQFPIIIKPTVNARNFRYLPELVEWTKKIGASCVYPQPMDRWTPETYEKELWVEGSELTELETVIETLVQMVERGEPILAPPTVLKLIPDHFREKSAPRETLPCRVGVRNYMIRANGDVQLCHHGFPVVGNVKTKSAREIWYGDDARRVRRDTVTCEQLCLVTCVSQKTLGDKVKMGMKLLKGAKRKSAASAETELA